ncbi:MAG: crh [Planctomycetota bacterium]|nr:crh [Planctomycetota bacterium]
MMAQSRREVQIVNSLGLHLRAADVFVRLAQNYQAEIRVVLAGKDVNGKSILELVSLAGECGTRVELIAVGPDAEEAMAALCELIETGFHEVDSCEDEASLQGIESPISQDSSSNLNRPA